MPNLPPKWWNQVGVQNQNRLIDILVQQFMTSRNKVLDNLEVELFNILGMSKEEAAEEELLNWWNSRDDDQYDNVKIFIDSKEFFFSSTQSAFFLYLVKKKYNKYVG